MTLLETITAWQREALSIQPPSGARLSSIVLSECESSPQNLPYRVHDWLESCWNGAPVPRQNSIRPLHDETA